MIQAVAGGVPSIGGFGNQTITHRGLRIIQWHELCVAWLVQV